MTGFAVLTVAALGSASAQATYPGENGEIAFAGTTNRIYSISPGGGHARVLTPKRLAAIQPSFSADGRRIVALVFVHASRHNQITSMNSDGSHRRRLTDSALDDGEPAFSPSGNAIAFTRATGPNHVQNGIWIMRADGSHQRLLTAPAESPAFSPNGHRIAFVAPVNGHPEVFVVRADGSHRRQLTDDPRGVAAPDFSPGGRSIVYMRSADPRCYCVGEVDVVRTDGTHQRRLTRGHGDSQPVFSPDGLRIAFSRYLPATGVTRVFTMNRDGTRRRLLTPKGTDNNFLDPTWQPIRPRLR